MTSLIKLTLLACEFYPYERETLVNPANISHIYRDTEFDDDDTYVEMNSGTTLAVKESPQEILQMIFNAEHPECKL